MPDTTTPSPAATHEPAVQTPLRVNAGVPAWAVLPVAWKLMVESIKHPKSGALILIDANARTVEARPLRELGELERTGGTLRDRRDADV